jgi:hypothetical protein
LNNYNVQNAQGNTQFVSAFENSMVFIDVAVVFAKLTNITKRNRSTRKKIVVFEADYHDRKI